MATTCVGKSRTGKFDVNDGSDVVAIGCSVWGYSVSSYGRFRGYRSFGVGYLGFICIPFNRFMRSGRSVG
jgi:hypothetical protein